MALSAAILAGGQARRYGGRDKSMLVVDGRSIRDRQIAELATIARATPGIRAAAGASSCAIARGAFRNVRAS